MTKMDDKINYKFVFNGEKTELFNRDCSLLMDEKKICVYIYTYTHTHTRVQFGPRTSVICYENKL